MGAKYLGLASGSYAFVRCVYYRHSSSHGNNRDFAASSKKDFNQNWCGTRNIDYRMDSPAGLECYGSKSSWKARKPQSKFRRLNWLPLSLWPSENASAGKLCSPELLQLFSRDGVLDGRRTGCASIFLKCVLTPKLVPLI